ncbi:hypothetical protein OIU78_021430 [Salix suchowensis]|nr:hypothetical protein OIU78_021430 [Salix suchowensis]
MAIVTKESKANKHILSEDADRRGLQTEFCADMFQLGLNFSM